MHARVVDGSVPPVLSMLPNYHLAEPTEESAMRSFERVLGAEQTRAIWRRACESVGLRSPRPSLSRDQLRRVAAYLATQSGFVGVMGKALEIRIETYETLSQSWDRDQESKTGFTT